jgi:imidazolonepropionase-like amidohydrolase
VNCADDVLGPEDSRSAIAARCDIIVGADFAWTGDRLIGGPVCLGVKDGRIVWLSAGLAPVPGALFYSNCTLMPMLADGHVHYLLQDDGNAPESDESMAHIKAGQLRQGARGVRVARDLGGASSGPSALVAVKWAGRAIAGHTGGLASSHRPLTAAAAATITEAEIAAGSDVIKIFASAGIASDASDWTAPTIDPDIVASVVSVAHERGVRVAAHALGARPCGIVIDAGVDTIEHGAGLTRAQANEMAARGIALVPTLSIYRSITQGTSPASAVGLQVRARKVLQALKMSVGHAATEGVLIGVGTDQGQSWNPVCSPLPELLALAEVGLSPSEVLTAATSVTAKVIGADEYAGRLVAGAPADVLVVAGNPLSDVAVLEHGQALILGGRLQPSSTVKPTRGQSTP